MATTTMQTPRLTQQYQMTTIDRLVLPHGAVCFRLAMILPGDFVSQFVSRSSASHGDLELENIFEDQGVSWLIIDEMFALELETKRRCFPAQLVLSALQRYNRHKCAHLLRDLAAAADLRPHRALFSQQLLTHRWWSEGDDNDIGKVGVLSLAAAAYIHI